MCPDTWAEVICLAKRRLKDRRDTAQHAQNVFIEERPFAYAYHRLLGDNQGNSVDHVFLAVNKAFEDITSLKGKDIIGRRVTKASPGYETTLPNGSGFMEKLFKNNNRVRLSSMLCHSTSGSMCMRYSLSRIISLLCLWASQRSSKSRRNRSNFSAR